MRVSFYNRSEKLLKVSRAVVSAFGFGAYVLENHPVRPVSHGYANFMSVGSEPWRVCLDELISNGVRHSSMQPSIRGTKYSPYLTIIPQTQKTVEGVLSEISKFEFAKTTIWKPLMKCQPTSIVLSLRDRWDELVHIDPNHFNFCCELRIKQRVLLSFT